MDTHDNDPVEYACEHCEWKGRSILAHLRYNNSCKSKTDVELLKMSIQEKTKPVSYTHLRAHET